MHAMHLASDRAENERIFVYPFSVCLLLLVSFARQLTLLKQPHFQY
jgi:hypothetical protein